jgi:hypothetical protein
MVGMMWTDEGEEGKKIWKAKAEQVKEEHMRLHPDYSYQPRKPSEKKRRMTKRKNRANQAGAGIPTSVEPAVIPIFSPHPENSNFIQCTIGTNNLSAELSIDSSYYPMSYTTPDSDTTNRLGLIQQSLEEKRIKMAAAGADTSALTSEETEVDGDNVFQFLADDVYAEQARQIDLASQVANFDIFGSDIYEPFAPFELA